jgi:flagellar basal body rod protein FlgC
MINPVNTPKNALNTNLQGLQRAAVQAAQAANQIQNAFTSAQNAQAADSVAVTERAAVIPAIEDAVRGAVLPAQGDIATAMVSLLQASIAYKANVAAANVTADIESDAVKLLRR